MGLCKSVAPSNGAQVTEKREVDKTVQKASNSSNKTGKKVKSKRPRRLNGVICESQIYTHIQNCSCYAHAHENPFTSGVTLGIVTPLNLLLDIKLHQFNHNIVILY